jgi:hypothetical protein
VMDDSLVAWVGSDVRIYIDGINMCVALYWNVGGYHPRLLASVGGMMILR